MDDSEKLQLMLILCSICISQDVSELKSFISVCSRHVNTNDFNKILRKTMKILEYKRCGTCSCPDWLMNELFLLYKEDFLV
jgi:hypothetical protein